MNISFGGAGNFIAANNSMPNRLRQPDKNSACFLQEIFSV